HLYKGLLRAVRYSKPSRFIVRDELRLAYRKSDSGAFDEGKIARTLEFIEGAAREKGIESQILKNMCHTEHMRRFTGRNAMHRPKGVAGAVKEKSFEHYNSTIAMLNDSMGMCLPVH
ncbi:hypothetical protein O988_07770, partial [Pseudogymnoascus sp. VKM F-3808]